MKKKIFLMVMLFATRFTNANDVIGTNGFGDFKSNFKNGGIQKEEKKIFKSIKKETKKDEDTTLINPKEKKKPRVNKNEVEKKVMQSNFINQEYTVSVSVPKSYIKTKKYPVVFLVDGNIYFDIMAQTFHHYAEAAVMPEAILVGIGYKDYATTNTLRSRDFTYPKADPKEKIPLMTGGAKEFVSFINTQVVPYVDAKYSVDTTKQILMGHSLGGYFTLYALYTNLAAKNHIFTNYIAASPTAFYENNYIINAFQNANFEDNNQTQAYVTFGGLENDEFHAITTIKREDVLSQLESALKTKNGLNYSNEIFSGLAHTDTPLPTFIKALKLILKKQ
ncbi:alpha/beta hydrolase [Flavobacterium succinicans]|uniref:Ferri-bacillibactin esterase BesA n=1 Tax=Flavobacterium succinicans TaxID=29536 RepID=A0A199XNM6_9FLAO|nr:alpha/beta hydrolase-fold protein [Flavobacterium succinicans]OAZ03235.1 ferri-bacillibactin esterase BesA [Flavobacterium succinicans]